MSAEPEVWERAKSKAEVISGGRGQWDKPKREVPEVVSLVARIDGKKVSTSRDGDCLEVALSRWPAWPDDMPPMVSLRRIVTEDAHGTGVAKIDIKRDRRKREAGGSWVGRPAKLGWFSRSEAEALGYALLAAVEELDGLESE